MFPMFFFFFIFFFFVEKLFFPIFLFFFSFFFFFLFAVVRADAKTGKKKRREVPIVKMTCFFCEKRFLGLGGQGRV